MKDAHFAEQEHACPRALPLADLRPEGYKQRLYVDPADRAVDRAGEDQFQRGSVTLFHGVPSTIFWYCFQVRLRPCRRAIRYQGEQLIKQVVEVVPAGLPGNGHGKPSNSSI